MSSPDQPIVNPTGGATLGTEPMAKLQITPVVESPSSSKPDHLNPIPTGGMGKLAFAVPKEAPTAPAGAPLPAKPAHAVKKRHVPKPRNPHYADMSTGTAEHIAAKAAAPAASANPFEMIRDGIGNAGKALSAAIFGDAPPPPAPQTEGAAKTGAHHHRHHHHRHHTHRHGV